MHSLICGLGNPGPEYERTRHNVGFAILERIVSITPDGVQPLSDRLEEGASAVAFKKWKNTEVFEAKGKDLVLTLLRPLTFMNLSGEAVSAYSDYYKVPASNLIVVHDEADLPFGEIRAKLGGGDAGHNGLKSITQHLGTPNYFRIRVGVGRPNVPANLGNQPNLADWVLGKFTSQENVSLGDLSKKVIAAINALIDDRFSAKALAHAQSMVRSTQSDKFVK